MDKENILNEIKKIKEINHLNDQRITELEAELKKLEESEPWKPEFGELYYSCAVGCGVFVNSFRWSYCEISYGLYNAGNCFPTKERAEQVAEKIRLLLKLERYHDMFCPDYVPDWKDSTHNHCICHDEYNNKWKNALSILASSPSGVYFDSEETAQKVCDLLNREEDNKIEL